MMRSQLYRWLLTAGLATTSLVATVEVASAQPAVRDHRDRQGPPGPPANMGPREAPPPPRVERQRPRRGFVWVDGNWDWQRGRWQWQAGHWEKERGGKRWRKAKWESRDGVYVRVDGDWIDDGPPSAAPPPLREERIRKRRGFVFVRGSWDWRNGDWQWTPGHWEKQRRGNRWREAKWENRNGSWFHVDGGWEAAAEFPTMAPPELQVENVRPRRGFVYVRGNWQWDNGQYVWQAGHWERERRNQRWNDGRWEMRDGRYQWTAGGWGANVPPPAVNAPPPAVNAPPPVVVSGPTVPPPALRPEAVQQRRGFIFVRGHYEWSNNQYQWTPGHWERQRAGARWVDSRWELQGRVWVQVPGGWR
jgi:hypothetical protein